MSQTIEFTQRLLKYSTPTEVIVFKPLLDSRLQGFLSFNADTSQLLGTGTCEIRLAGLDLQQARHAIFTLVNSLRTDSWMQSPNRISPPGFVPGHFPSAQQSATARPFDSTAGNVPSQRDPIQQFRGVGSAGPFDASDLFPSLSATTTGGPLATSAPTGTNGFAGFMEEKVVCIEWFTWASYGKCYFKFVISIIYRYIDCSGMPRK